MTLFERLLFGAIAVYACVSCGQTGSGTEALLNGPIPAQGVLHLDPRLDSGLSSSAELTQHKHTVREWSMQGALELPEAWKLDGGVLAGPGPNGGLRLGLMREARTAPTLRFLGPISPAEMNSIEVDLVILASARASVAWFRPSPLEAGAALSLCEAAPEVQTLRFAVGANKTWGKLIEKLIVKLSSNRVQGFELLAIRFVHEPFAWGQSPLDPEGGFSGDAGLLVRGGTACRAWPARIGAALRTRAIVPIGGKLSVQVARGATSSPIPLNSVVTVFSDGSTTPIVSIYPLPLGDEEWHAGLLDLGEFAGQEVAMTFEVEPALGAAADSVPRADILFGAPMMLGALPEDRRPNILLVTLDTLRFDALGSSQESVLNSPAEGRVQTKFLDTLAESSFVFENAWSAGNSTQPSHASILTGVSIQDHSLNDNFGVLGDGNTTLAERLRTAGYQTAAVTCQRAIGPDAGFGQGFDLFIPAETVSGLDGRLAVDKARAWIEEWSAEGDRPFFLWVHVFDPHTPYELPGDFLETYKEWAGAIPPRQSTPATLPKAKVVPAELAFLGDITSAEHVDYLYHAEVAYTDSLMADLFGTLGSLNLQASTMSFVTADHGEFLGERGNFYNHRGLFPETLHVPLLLKLPGATAGQRIASRVTNRDIVPTVLGQLGLLDVNPARDLVSVAQEAPEVDRRLWFEHANGLQVGCRDGEYHFITTLRGGLRFGIEESQDSEFAVMKSIPLGQSFLFDVQKDPGLHDNLAQERPKVVEAYLHALADYRAAARPIARLARDISSSEAADLEALGYTGD